MTENFDKQTKITAKSQENISASPELVHCFEDASSVARSYFGSPNIKTAVVVVPNRTDYDTRQFIKAAGNRAFISFMQVIPEHIAVDVAYRHKAKPTDSSKIVIVSSTAGACDVRVVSLNLEGKSYVYEVESRESCDQEPTSDPVRMGVTRVPHWIVYVYTTLICLPSKDKSLLEKVVVFVGKSAELEKIREIIIKGFSEVKEWGKMEDSEQLAAYGAAVVASSGKPVLYSYEKENVSSGPFFGHSSASQHRA